VGKKNFEDFNARSKPRDGRVSNADIPNRKKPKTKPRERDYSRNMLEYEYVPENFDPEENLK
jgi:hypothetical protein